MNMIRLKVKTWSWRPNKMPSIRKKRMPEDEGGCDPIEYQYIDEEEEMENMDQGYLAGSLCSRLEC